MVCLSFFPKPTNKIRRDIEAKIDIYITIKCRNDVQNALNGIKYHIRHENIVTTKTLKITLTKYNLIGNLICTLT